MEPGDPHEQVGHPHVAVEAALLGHVPPRACGRSSVAGDLAPRDRASVGLQHPEQDAHQGGLAGAVRSEQADHPSGGHLEVDAIEHHPIAEPLADGVGPKRSMHGHQCSPPGTGWNPPGTVVPLMGSLIKKRRKRMRKKKHKKMLKRTRWQRRAAGK